MSDGQSRAISLRSNQWSCSELTKGAEMCASLAGLDLAVDPKQMSRNDLLQAIKDPSTESVFVAILSWQQHHVFKLVYNIQTDDPW